MEPKRREYLSSMAFGAVALILGLILIPVQVTTATSPQNVDIQVSSDGIVMSFLAVGDRDLLTFSVRIVGPERFVFEQRVQDATVQWIPPDHLTDGTYNWEAWIVTADPTASMRELTPELQKRSPDHWFEPEAKQTHVASGSFQVKHGVIEEAPSREPGGSTSRVHRVAGVILDFLVPSAHAQNFTDNVVVTKSVPEVRYEHTGTGARNWSTGFNPLAGWYVRDLTANTFPFVVQPAAPSSSLVIRQDGTVSLPGGAWDTASSEGDFRVGSTDHRMKIGVATGGGGAGNATIATQGGTNTLFLGSGTSVAEHRFVTIRGALGRFGIGTTNPQDLLHLNRSGGQQLRLSDGTTTVRAEGFSNSFRIMDGSSLSTRYGFDVQAPPSTIRAIASGNVGFGTAAPAAPVHVWRANNSARITVEDSGATASADIMFALSNNGNPQFRMENTATDRVWNFRTQDFGECSESNTCFVINKRSGPRFRFMQDGDMFIEGAYEQSSSRAVKSAINALAPEELLGRLKNLGVYEWSYSHNPQSRHIGPMAEDFYNAFGLGSSDKSISPANLAGVSLAATQVLHQRVEAVETLAQRVADAEALNQKIENENLELRERLEQLEAVLHARM